MIPIDEQEGSHMIMSHAGRDPSALGLIGAFIVEPKGSKYLDPWDSKPVGSGWEVMITNDEERDFREFVLFYHEVGDESFRPLNRFGEMIPQRDPLTDAYRPSARAMNYRSEPFGINNLAQQEKKFDEEQVLWLGMIKDHIAGNLSIDTDDFEYAPFSQEGGLGKVYQLFGDELNDILYELNEALAA